MFKYVLFALLLCAPVSASAQVEVADTKGTDFWFTFLPNYFSSSFADNTLRVYITSDSTSRGVISWQGRNGNSGAVEFQVSAADPTFEYSFRENDYAIQGLSPRDASNDPVDPNNTELEEPLQRSVHVTVEEGAEVSVYALSKALWSSDASLVFPTDVLGTHYAVMSYPSEYREFGWPFSRMSMESKPSQFAITATEDATTVVVTTSTTRTWRAGGNERTVVLSQGETVLFQAAPSEDDAGDFTGTQISANKPIAVFAGHQRTQIPIEDGLSRDILFEQLAPWDTWGNEVLLVPFAEIARIFSPGRDIVRIVSLRSETVIQFGAEAITLDAFEYVERVLPDEPTLVRSNKPIQVAQFKQSSSRNGSENIGDPFMMMIPPFEQFLRSYTWMNAQVGDDITEQYATIVATTASVGSLAVDGLVVPSTEFETVPNTNFVVATLSVSDGMHTATSEHPFGLYVYGYGPADSYGYVGGQQLAILDVRDTMSVYASINDTVRGEAGDTIGVSIVLDSLNFLYGRGGLQSVSFDSVYVQLSADPTVVSAPFAAYSEVVDGRYVFQTSGTWSAFSTGDTVVSFDILLGLGDMRFSDIRIDSMWLNDISRSNHGSKVYGSGTIVELQGLWQPLGRDRLLNTRTQGLSVKAEFANSTMLELEVTGLEANKPAFANVFDQAGKLLTEESFNPSTTQLDISLSTTPLSSGAYSIIVRQGVRRAATQILFVQ